MNIQEFARNYLGIELKDHQLHWLEHIKNMKQPIVVFSHITKTFTIIDKEKSTDPPLA